MTDFPVIFPAEPLRKCTICGVALKVDANPKATVCSLECRRLRGIAYSRQYQAENRKRRAFVFSALGVTDPSMLDDPDTMQKLIERLQRFRKATANE